jgi:hypothetical protein
MATQPPLGDVQDWPYEYKGWKITFHVLAKPLVAITSPMFREPTVEHLHEDDKQLVRWTKRVQVDKKTWQRLPPEDQLCCFICAEYMPRATWNYFERCKEMTKCVSTGNE